ncbi:MAG: P-loop NTPase [Desulfobacteraceae bacterium]|jgi:flagellar biosynthesis protein FlhG
MSRIYPIGGGKGGSGKSFLTVNLGVLFAKQGKRVVLIDLDLGGSNLHTLLGLTNPNVGLNDFLNKMVSDLHDAAVPTLIPNLFMISSMNCSMEIANLFYAQKMKIIKAIQALHYECILLDLGAGTNYNTLDFFLSSNEGLFVVTPEPTSIENTFRFIRAVYLRKIKQLLRQGDFISSLRDMVSNLKNGSVGSPVELIEYVKKHDHEKGKLLQDRLAEFELKFVLNQFRKQTDVTLGDKIERVCNKHFYSRFRFLDNIVYDERVHDSIFSKEVYINKYPYTSTATALESIANKIVSNGIDPAVQPSSL